MSNSYNRPNGNSFQKRNSAPRNPPTKYELFTGGKVAYPEFTIFYNIAYFRVAGVINHFKGEKYTESKDKLEKDFKNWLKKPKDDSDEKVFAGLHNYLWKGYNTAKNASGKPTEQDEKDLIIEMLTKLEVIRNFHSHYYHDNSVLIFSHDFKQRIEYFHDDAQLAFAGKYPDAFTKYNSTIKERPFFKAHDGKNYITADGKTFFLSFFLTRSEMARFLQQRKGYKRTDGEEFNIKHLIYRHYTHRDGAARQHYGHADNILDSMTTGEQKDAMNARQAFKLISYLNDIPPVSYDIDLFPLFLNNNLVQTPQDYIDFCTEKGLFTEGVQLHLSIKTMIDDDTEEVEEIVKDYFLTFIVDGFSIELKKETLHKLILDAFRSDDKGAKTIGKLYEFVEERVHFYNLATDEGYLEAQYDNEHFKLSEEMNEYYRYKLRNKKLQEKMGLWAEKLEKRKTLNEEKFINRILTMPIEVKYYDFYFEDEAKPRPVDLFTRFAVKYLIDFQKTPDWHWLFEKYEMVTQTKSVLENGKKIEKTVTVNTRKTFYSPVFSSKNVENTEGGTDLTTEPRLAVTDDGQIVVSIYTDTCDRGKPPVYKFLLGHRAIKNLLIAESENKSIKDFFTPIILDIKKIRENNGKPLALNQLSILKENEMPSSFKNAMKISPLNNETLRAKAKSRIENIIREIEPFANGEDVYNLRSDKNRQIMRCYKYFDWHYEQGSQFKFLRQDEYQRMSVYHYCLENRRNPDLERGDFAFLIKDALPHTPTNIKNLLKKSQNIEHLLQGISKDTISLMTNWLRDLPILKGERLQSILGKLGISSYRHNEPLQEYIPFDIHPMLVVRCFYPDKLNEKYTSISRELWVKPINRKGLIEMHYKYENYFKVIETFGNEEKKVKKQIIGAMNELKTQDILLWRMAKAYLKETSPAYLTFLQWEQKEDDWKVGNLRNTTFKAPFFNLEINGRKTNKLFLSIKFHQMDDFLLIESKDVIEKAIKQVLMRYENTNQAKIIKYEITQDAKGFKVIPYQEVFKEIQRVYNDSLHWARYIWDWERNIVDAMLPQKHQQLEQEKINAGDKGYINFNDVLTHAALNEPLEKAIRELRNKTFHAEIPDGWAYWQMENDATYADLRQLLQYQPKTKFDYENRIEKNVNNEAV